MPKTDHSSEIDHLAARWAARLDRGPLSVTEQDRLSTWTGQDTRHTGALARAMAVNRHFDKAVALGPDYAENLAGTTYPAGAVESRGHRQGWRRGLAAAAAGVLLLLLGGLLLDQQATEYSTGLGEVRRLALADGSTLTLNTRTRATVKYSRNLRRVELLEGEILLDVLPDAARPFVVDSGDSRVTVTGTRFSVRRQAGRSVEVMVVEGSVEMRSRQPERAGEPAPVRLAANTRALSQSDRIPEIQRMEPDETARRLKWREGMLAFDGITLAEAAAEFARYSDTRIRIDDPAVAERKVVGLFVATDPRGFARAAAVGLGLEAEEVPDGIRLVTQANE